MTLPFVIKIFVVSVFEWPFYTGFIVQICHPRMPQMTYFVIDMMIFRENIKISRCQYNSLVTPMTATDAILCDRYDDLRENIKISRCQYNILVTPMTATDAILCDRYDDLRENIKISRCQYNS